ncbi:hypothetical protein [Arsenicibacter rosenii]|uniref:Uncharacterized protein n=1 Tax=Arsenicibacter rosenii TaxID=1750698 RepID=A0A1S2VMA6_9BACT|nr:hypothetical protein [Arsenicibacter rosenii]OIN59355.1 hypothetical protein BLX24_10270 [Arsenicibacter rosenii]
MWLFLYLFVPTVANLITLLILACWGYLLAAALYSRFRQSELTVSVVIMLALPIGLAFLRATPFLSFSQTSLLVWLPCLLFTLSGYFYILIRKH